MRVGKINITIKVIRLKKKLFDWYDDDDDDDDNIVSNLNVTQSDGGVIEYWSC